MTKVNQNPVTPHKWTEAEKRLNCACCTLAEVMRDCKACPFAGMWTESPKVTKIQKDNFCIVIM